VGVFKAESLISYLKDLNPLVEYTAYTTHLTPQNAEDIVSQYDLVLDCTDHPTSRYLISDICVLLGKPLVSASALRTDGQLIVLNAPVGTQGGGKGGPCYRCVFPVPPPAESLTSCGEGGVLGPAVGTMGVLQAGEAIKVLLKGMEWLESGVGDVRPSLMLFSSPLSGGMSMRTVRMKGRSKDCFACGEGSKLSLGSLKDGSTDYVAFCGGNGGATVNLLKPEERVSATQYADRRKKDEHLLLDVREAEHFSIASIDGAVNVPFSRIHIAANEEDISSWLPPTLPPDAPIYVVCRVGNDSQVVARRMKEMGIDGAGKRVVVDIKGGMRAWKNEVDETLPFT
jgi:adenylyltransferase/sulfurtransferase